MSILCTLNDILAQLTAGLTINNDCEAPLPVASCPDNPLEVTIVDDPSDVVSVQAEYVCNADTGVYDLITITITNGVAGEPVVTPTEISCEDPATPVVTVDLEFVCNADTGLFDLVSVTTTDGVSAEPVITPTAISCVAPVVTVDTELVCNEDTEVYDLVSITTTDGVAAAPVVTPTTFPCAQPPVVEIDVEYVCNEDTDVYDSVTTTTTDGVAAPPVIVPTTIPCDEEPDVVTVDVELVCNADTEVYDQVVTTTTNGVPAEPVITPTTISCAEPPSIEIETEYVCNTETGFYDEITITTTDGVAGDPVVVATTIECVAPTVEIDLEYECNDETGFFDQISTTITDGVAAEPVITTTTLPCVAAPPDFEIISECRPDTNTIWVVTYSIDADGVQTEINAADTGQVCPSPQTECVKWSSTVVFFDNTGTRFTESHEITVTNVDGTETVINAAPTTGWTQQLQEWQAQFQAAYPEAIVEVRCNIPGGCGGLLAPPSDAQPSDAIQWRYLSMIHCPTDQKIPVKAEITDSSNPARIGRVLVYDSVQTPEKRGYRCVDCETGYGNLKNEDGTEVPESDLPVCVFSCAETIPQSPESACTFDALEGGCDDVNSDDETLWVPTTRIVSICDGVISADYYTEDPDGGLEDYELIGNFVECDSGTVVPDPEPVPCERADIIRCDGEPALCAHAIGGLANGGSFDISEGGIEWTICGTAYPIGQGTYSWQEMADAVAAASGVSTEVVDAADGSQSIVVRVTCCEAGDVQFQIGEDEPVLLALVPELNTEAGEESCAELTVGCNDDRRDDLLSDLIDVLPVGPSECSTGGGANEGNCDCPITSAQYDPDQGSQWGAFSVSGSTATIEAGPNGTGSWHEQMNGTNPQCSGDMWIARMGGYDGPPGTGTLIAEGYLLGSVLNASGVTNYALGAPIRPSTCSAASLETALVDAGFTAAEAASLVANGYATVDVFGTPGVTHINGVFDGGAPTPFGVCLSFDTDACEDAPTEEGDDVLFTEDACANETLGEILAELQCAKPVGSKLCYGGDEGGETETTEYVNSDNTTELSASQNDTTIKWQLSPGQEQDADDFSEAIEACIASGEIANITWTDQDGTTVAFAADTSIGAAPNYAFTGTSSGSWSGKVNRATLVCGEGATASGGTAQMWVGGCETDPVWKDCETGAELTAEEVATLAECAPTGCVEVCPDCPNETVQVIVCADEDAEGVTAGDQILLAAVRDCEGVLQSSIGYNLSEGNAEVAVPSTSACDPEPEVEEVRECLVDSAGVQWTQLVIVQADLSQSDPIFINSDTLAIGTPAGEPEKWTACEVPGNTHLIEGCVDDGEGNAIEGFTIVDDNGDPLFPPKSKVSLGFMECPNLVAELIGDGDECPCEDDCATTYADCATTDCRLLRVDADGSSFSQATLDGYRLQVAFGVGGAEGTCPGIDVSVGEETGALVVVDADGHPEVENFATAINSALGSYGFSAVICPGASSGGTGGSDTMLAITGPACADTPWEIKFDSNGTGDDYALGWTGTEWYTREFVNGSELTNPTNDYNSLGAWDARPCTNC